MTFKAWVIIATEVLLSALVVVILLGQVSSEKKRAEAAETLAKQRQETITDMQTRQRDVAALDAKYTKELADVKAENDALQRKLDRGGRVLGCSSREVAQCSPQPKTPDPPAWAMMPPSNSLQLLDETFSVSDPESIKTNQP